MKENKNKSKPVKASNAKKHGKKKLTQSEIIDGWRKVIDEMQQVIVKNDIKAHKSFYYFCVLLFCLHFFLFEIKRCYHSILATIPLVIRDDSEDLVNGYFYSKKKC